MKITFFIGNKLFYIRILPSGKIHRLLFVTTQGGGMEIIMPKNYLLIYSEQLASEIELLCQNIKAPSNTLFQIRKSSSSIYANVREANYGQSRSDMISKFEIALKECNETEGWLKLLFNTNVINEEIFKNYRNLCGRIRRMLIASCKTLKEVT